MISWQNSNIFNSYKRNVRCFFLLFMIWQSIPFHQTGFYFNVSFYWNWFLVFIVNSFELVCAFQHPKLCPCAHTFLCVCVCNDKMLVILCEKRIKIHDILKRLSSKTIVHSILLFAVEFLSLKKKLMRRQK